MIFSHSFLHDCELPLSFTVSHPTAISHCDILILFLLPSPFSDGGVVVEIGFSLSERPVCPCSSDSDLQNTDRFYSTAPRRSERGGTSSRVTLAGKIQGLRTRARLASTPLQID